jgi:multiple sugar transport system substrate-binding protein
VQKQAISITRREAVKGVAASAALALTGCSRRSDDVVRFWSVGREAETARGLVRDFMVKNPSIRVEVQQLPWTAAHEKLLTAYAGEALPDLCQLGNTWVPEFEALDALEPLDRFVSGSDVALEDYFPEFLNSNRINNVLYGVPWYVDTRILYYRRDLLAEAGFDAPPTTWDEWQSMLGAIKEMVGPKRYSVLLPLNEFEQLLVLALQQPSELLRDNGRYGNFRSPDFRTAIDYFYNMFQREWAPRMTNTQISNVWDEFGNGLFSFYMSGPWNIAEFQKRLPPRLKDAWMTAPMPGPNGPGVSSAGGASLVIFRSSRLKEQAWKLAEYLSGVDVQRRFYQVTGDLPPRISTWETEELVRSPYARAFRMQLDRVRAPPKVPEWERIAQEMRMAAERVIQGTSTIEQATIALDRKADEILEKRRWMMDRAST